MRELDQVFDLLDERVDQELLNDRGDLAIEVGLRMLLLRHFVEEENGLYRTNPNEEILLRYYANAIAHLLPAASATPVAAE